MSKMACPYLRNMRKIYAMRLPKALKGQIGIVGIVFLIATARLIGAEGATVPSPRAITPSDVGANAAPNTQTQGKRDADTAPPLATAAPQETTKPAEHDTSEKAPQGTSNGATWPATVQAISDGFIAAFTVVLAVFGCLQWRIYCRQADILKQQTEISKSQLLTSQVELRAYVFVTPHKVKDREPYRDFWIKIENGGHSFAYRMTNRTGCAMMEWPVRSRTQLVQWDDEVRPIADLGPHVPVIAKLTAKEPITKEEIMDSGKGTRRLVLYGEIAYMDAFGEERITNFCWCYDTAANQMHHNPGCGNEHT
jgi:hypothetical protein